MQTPQVQRMGEENLSLTEMYDFIANLSFYMKIQPANYLARL